MGKGWVKALYILSTGRVLCSKDVSVGCFFSLCFGNSELLNSHLGCFSAVTLKAAGRKEASDLSLRRVLLPLSLFADVRLAKAQVTPSCTVVMKLSGCFKSSTGRATHTTLICSTLSDVKLIDWIDSYWPWNIGFTLSTCSFACCRFHHWLGF